MSGDYADVQDWIDKGCRWEAVPHLLRLKHADQWVDQPMEYWFARFVAEVGELGAALAHDHEHPWQLEAAQCAAILLNMLAHLGAEETP